MKRSDMIKLMVLALGETERGGKSEMSFEEQMDYLLSKMEEAGMEPFNEGSAYHKWDDE